MDTISTIQRNNTIQFFTKQEEREKTAPKNTELQEDQVSIQNKLYQAAPEDIERVSHWTAQDAQKALDSLEGKNLFSVHGELDPARVKMLINRIAA